VDILAGITMSRAEEIDMDSTVDVTIPVDADAARILENPVRRAAIGRYVSGLLKGQHVGDALAEAIADVKREARANGLTDDQIDAELDAWRTERPA
jgi:hypothetical protein